MEFHNEYVSTHLRAIMEASEGIMRVSATLNLVKYLLFNEVPAQVILELIDAIERLPTKTAETP